MGALQFLQDASLWFLSLIRRRNPITAHHEDKKGGQCFTIPPMSQVQTASCCCFYDSEIVYVWLNNNFKPILTPVGKLFPTWQVFYVKIASVLVWLQPYFILTVTNTTYAPFLLSHGLLWIAKHKNITTWIIYRSQNLCGLKSWFLQAYIPGNTFCKWQTIQFTSISSERNEIWKNRKVHLKTKKIVYSCKWGKDRKWGIVGENFPAGFHNYLIIKAFYVGMTGM